MKYIDSKRYKQIKELADAGDEHSKEFLFSFMEMDDEKANEFLMSLDGEMIKKEDDIKGAIDFLIKDENEAIDGYDKAIKLVTNSDIDEETKKRILDVLEHIKQEEIEHIEELKGIL